jgi:two-component system cell cycle sensor histidine kinase/response regulator CckA
VLVASAQPREGGPLSLSATERSGPEPLRLSLSHRERLERLLETSRELSKIQPLESLLAKIAETCGHLLDSDSVGIRIREEDDLVLAGAYGDAREAMPTPRLKIGESLSGTVAATGEPLIVWDPARDPRMTPAHREAYRRGGYKAFLGVPLMLGPQVLGVLSVRTRREQGFSLEDLALAMAFAAQAAIALENSRLYQETRRACEELSQTQDQLTQARKMEAVGRLAGGIAHDFNNLLTVLIGRSQLLLRRLGAQDPVRADIEVMEQTADRAADLTRQLLAFSRKQVLQPTVLDLNAVVANLAEMLRRLIGEDIALATALDPALGRAKADPGQIEQIVINLAANARDAMSEGGRLTLETANTDLDAAYARCHVDVHPGPYVMLAVSDTGVGMTPETQAQIFEPFFTTKAPGQGTGLGLATVYGIVKQSGGHIWVYSEPGRGTTFKIYLPRLEEAVDPSVARLVRPEPARGHETILLVEDELAVRTLVRDVLLAHGYTVLEARHGRDALRISERHSGPIHLMLTDVVMPEMSGRELAKRLVTLRPTMPVIYMSGYTDTAVVHHGVLDPGTTFLQKPFTPDALVRKIQQVLDPLLAVK